MPCTTCECERSFSTLRRIKTYLRSTMNQDRLNYVMVLNVHHSEAEKLRITKMEAFEQQKLCLDKIIDDWINQSVQRKNIFATSDSFGN